MKHYPLLNTSIIDIVDLVVNGELVEALTKYYHPSAWLPKRETVAPFAKGAQGGRALDFLNGNKSLLVERALNIGLGQHATFITWVYTAHVGAGIKASFTVMSIQHWKEGKVVREEFLHAN